MADIWEVWATPGDTLEHLIRSVHYGTLRDMGLKERLGKYEEKDSEMIKKTAHLSGTDPITMEDIQIDNRLL